MQTSKDAAELTRKRAELKKRLENIRNEYVDGKFETRSREVVETELRQAVDEIKQLDAQLVDIEERAATVEMAGKILATQNNTKEERKTMNIQEVRSTPQYHEAFFRHLMGLPMDSEQRAYIDSTAAGAAVIPTQTAERIFDKMVKVAPMLNEITLLRVAGNLKFAVENARADAAKHTENADITPASDSMTYVELAGYEYVKVQRVSATIRTLGIPAFEEWLTGALAEDVAEAIENAIINGDGSGDPKGVEYANTWVDDSTGIDFGTVITYDDVVDGLALLPARYHGRAKFLTNSAFFYGQVMKIKDANGYPLVVRDVAAGAPGMIMGFPVVLSDKVAASTMYLGDFTKVVGNLSQDITIEASASSGFLANAVDYRGVALFDCDIALADAIVKFFT